MQHLPHILGNAIGLMEPANESRRNPVDPLQLLHPDPKKTNKDRRAVVEVTKHKSVDKGGRCFEGQRTSNDPELPQLIIATAAYLINVWSKSELGVQEDTEITHL